MPIAQGQIVAKNGLWPNVAIVMTPILNLAAGQQYMVDHAPGGEAERNGSLVVPLKVVGVLTYRGMMVKCTAAMLSAIRSNVLFTYWFLDEQTGALTETNVIPEQSKIGQAYGWSDACIAVGCAIP